MCMHFVSVLMHLTDGTVCNELICDNYGSYWGKWRKKSPDEFKSMCVYVWRRPGGMRVCCCVLCVGVRVSSAER